MAGIRITAFDAAVMVGCFVRTLAFGIWSGRKRSRDAE